MTTRKIDEKLNSLLVETYSDRHNGTTPPYRENRIFTNRNIKLTRIQAVGFDLDYTLAEYNQDALDMLTMRLALGHMVEAHGYPEEIMAIPYKGAFAIRGLVMDTQLGNVLKMDKFKYVSLAYHGLEPLASEKRAALYNTQRISFNDKRYRSVDTLFEILEAYLYAALVDYLETQKKQETDYQELYTHLRGAIDLCHRDGSLKKQIRDRPEQYIKDDPLLIPMLHMFKDAGKRLFVLTNSERDYSEFMLNYLFRNASPFFKGWRSCFEIVGAAACKPSFFVEDREPIIHEDRDLLFFSGGNLEFLEERLQVKGDQLLYVGDHIYGDILKSKNTSSWRTCIIVPELIFQIRAEQEAKPLLKRLMQNETRRKKITMELHWRRNRIFDLHQFKEAEADELDQTNLQKIDERIAYLNRQLEANHKELSQLLCESKHLRYQISNSFNPYWGRLFKTGDQMSIFAEQIRDYACIYTAKLSNFNYYGSQSYLQSIITPMPHEDNLYQVGDLNFDVSMERHPGEEEGEAAVPHIIEHEPVNVL